MTRVAFVLDGPTFQGSVNYFRNLVSALALLPDRPVRPYVFIGRTATQELADTFRGAKVIRTSLLDDRSLGGRVRRRLKRHLRGRDPLLALLLAAHRIRILSHLGPLRGGGVRTIGWIPDFQHIYLPTFFDDAERGRRDAEFHDLVDRCDMVVLSSVAAQNDLAAFAPDAIAKSRVLQFVPSIEQAAVVSLADLEAKYGFHAPYFYMPNQFWIHKNHRIVVEALARLKDQGLAPTVLMTGSTKDYRHPDHYDRLIAQATKSGVADSFRVLGMVPYGDLLSLMQHALAVLNPSLFEGWSSSVEEAKALDKIVLLSNLPVHLEQAPPRGIFFDPADADDLAAKMQRVMEAADPAAAPATSLTLSDTYHQDRLRFAESYRRIVIDAIAA
ncbi:MAG: glycosyltransferase [Burkholderiaceae bacterium]